MIKKIIKISITLMNSFKTGDNTIDITNFLLASGFALLVVLVGWANQITSRSKETKELEACFLKKAKLKKNEYKKIVNEGGSTEGSFKALVNFLYTKKEEDIQILENIKIIKADIEKLDKKYSVRYWILLLMSACLFISGIVSFFLPQGYKLWTIVPNIIFIFFIFNNLIRVHILEKRFTKNISNAMEHL